MADPKHYIRQGSIDDENFLYLARKLGHHLNALNTSIENLDTSGTYNDLKKEIEDLKSVVEAIEEYDDTELREELQSLKDAIDAIEEYDDTELKESLYNLQDEISRLDGYLTQLNTSVTNIETAANNHYTLYDSAIEGIHESLNDLEEQIANLNNENYAYRDLAFSFKMANEVYSDSEYSTVILRQDFEEELDYISYAILTIKLTDYLLSFNIHPYIISTFFERSGCIAILQCDDASKIRDTLNEEIVIITMRIFYKIK